MTLAGALAGCGGGGGGEAGFDAEGFTEALNDGGARIELGEELLSTQEGVEVRAVRLKGGGGGSMIVAADEEAGVAEHARCESAITLLCYRAANVVLLLEDEVSGTQSRRLEAAFMALSTG